MGTTIVPHAGLQTTVGACARSGTETFCVQAAPENDTEFGRASTTASTRFMRKLPMSVLFPASGDPEPASVRGGAGRRRPLDALERRRGCPREQDAHGQLSHEPRARGRA